MFTVDAFDHVTEIWAEDPEQSGLEWLDNGDILSELSEGSGDFGADEAHPHDGYPDAVEVAHRLLSWIRKCCGE